MCWRADNTSAKRAQEGEWHPPEAFSAALQFVSAAGSCRASACSHIALNMTCNAMNPGRAAEAGNSATTVSCKDLTVGLRGYKPKWHLGFVSCICQSSLQKRKAKGITCYWTLLVGAPERQLSVHVLIAAMESSMVGTKQLVMSNSRKQITSDVVCLRRVKACAVQTSTPRQQQWKSSCTHAAFSFLTTP